MGLNQVDGRGIAKAQGVIRLGSYIPTNNVALIFRFEIRARVPGFAGKEESIFFNLGWCVLFPKFQDRAGLIDGEFNEEL